VHLGSWLQIFKPIHLSFSLESWAALCRVSDAVCWESSPINLGLDPAESHGSSACWGADAESRRD